LFNVVARQLVSRNAGKASIKITVLKILQKFVANFADRINYQFTLTANKPGKSLKVIEMVEVAQICPEIRVIFPLKIFKKIHLSHSTEISTFSKTPKNHLSRYNSEQLNHYDLPTKNIPVMLVSNFLQTFQVNFRQVSEFKYITVSKFCQLN